MKTSVLYPLSTCLVAAMLAGAAQAQESSAPQLEEIIVTAQKRSERLQDVPIAVSAITANQLTSAGVNSTQQLMAVVPSLNYNVSSGFAQPFIRGVGSTFVQPNAESSIATYVDGVYLSDTQAGVINLLAVDRIEVLRGPQGTLYGRNATGGAISVITRSPTQKNQGKVSLGYGNFDRMEASGYVEGGLTENLAGGFYAGYIHSNPYNKNVSANPSSEGYDDNQTQAARGKLVWTPTDTFALTVAAGISDEQGADTTAYRQTQLNAAGYLLGGQSAAECSKYGNYCANRPVFYKRRTHDGSVKAELDMGWANFSSLTAYHRNSSMEYIDFDATTVDLISYGAAPQRSSQWTQEFQLTSPEGQKVKWIAGVYGLDEIGGYYPTYVLVPAANINYALRGDVKTQSAAAFGQLTYPITENLNLTVGARYTVDKKTLRSVAFTVTDVNTTPLFPTAFFPEQDKSWKKFTPKVTLDYKVGDTLLYATYSQGYKSGVFNIPQPTDPGPVNPEVLKAYEAGTKSDFMDGRFRLNTAFFYYDYSNLQLSVQDTSSPAGTVVQRNAASAELYGAEFDATLAVTDAFTVTWSGAYTHSEYTKFPNLATFDATPLGNVPVVVDASGNPLQRAPKFTSSLSGNYVIMLANEDSIDLNASMYYNDGFNWDASGRVKQKAYTLLNASAAYTHGKAEFAVWAKNLTDKKYAVYRDLNGFGSDQQDAPPFTIGGTVSYKFGD